MKSLEDIVNTNMSEQKTYEAYVGLVNLAIGAGVESSELYDRCITLGIIPIKSELDNEITRSQAFCLIKNLEGKLTNQHYQFVRSIEQVREIK